MKPSTVLTDSLTSAPVAVGATDQMLEAITAYRAGSAAFRAIPLDQITKDNEERFVDATYGQAQDLISTGSLKVMSLAGVRESIRLALDEGELTNYMSENALRSALAFLDEPQPECPSPDRMSNENAYFDELHRKAFCLEALIEAICDRVHNSHDVQDRVVEGILYAAKDLSRKLTPMTLEDPREWEAIE